MIHTCNDIHGQGLKYVFWGKCRNIIQIQTFLVQVKLFIEKVGVVFCIVKHLYKKSYLRLTLRKKGSKFSG